MKTIRNQLGFTKVELVITLVLFLVLGGALYFAAQPETGRADGRDARRRSEVVAILNAVLKYQADHDGELPSAIDSDPSTAQVLGTAQNGCSSSCNAMATASACVDLSSDLLGTYLDSIPYDPKSGDATNSDYYINNSSGRIVVGSCDPEESNSISVMR